MKNKLKILVAVLALTVLQSANAYVKTILSDDKIEISKGTKSPYFCVHYVNFTNETNTTNLYKYISTIYSNASIDDEYKYNSEYVMLKPGQSYEKKDIIYIYFDGDRYLNNVFVGSYLTCITNIYNTKKTTEGEYDSIDHAFIKFIKK